MSKAKLKRASALEKTDISYDSEVMCLDEIYEKFRINEKDHSEFMKEHPLNEDTAADNYEVFMCFYKQDGKKCMSFSVGDV